MIVTRKILTPRAHHYAKDNIQSLSEELNIRPYTSAPKFVWKVAWRTHSRILPILHFRDPAAPKDKSQSLKVLWNKAIASLDSNSPVYEPRNERYTYYMLPRFSRLLLRVFYRLFPRLHHANIETRSAYLNRCIQKEIQDHQQQHKIRLVTIGAGYDTRSVRLLTENLVQQAWEMDLPSMVKSKKLMFDRLQQSFPDAKLPLLREIDLNDGASFQATLEEVLKDRGYHTIFVSEAVLIYLNTGMPARVLSTCAKQCTDSASLCFADLLETPDTAEDTGKVYLSLSGWDLREWRTKPGLARHMGVARTQLSG